jgi:hypothetical protein
MNKAFEDWKAAHDAYLAAERRLADAETVFAIKHGQDPQGLRSEVVRRRQEADRLLDSAMQAMRRQAGGPSRART